MVRMPFANTFDALFRGDHALPIKMAGSAVATAFVAVIGFARSKPNMDATAGFLVTVGLVAAVVGAYLGLALSLRDLARRRLDRGERLDLLLRLHSGQGWYGWMIWIPVALFVIYLFILLTEGPR